MFESRNELRKAFLDGFLNARRGTEEVPDNHDLFDAYMDGYKRFNKMFDDERNRLIDGLEIGSNFPEPYGHKEEIEQNRRLCSWRIKVPGDIVATGGRLDKLHELGSLAITEAKELAEDWCVPAHWEAIHEAGEPDESYEVTFLVTRTSRIAK